MKTILITGASGFIGGFLVEKALKRNYIVYAGVRKTSKRNYLVDPGIKFIELDLSDKTVLNNQFLDAPHFDFIIHNAALTKALRKEDYFISNYHCTRNLIDTLINMQKIPKKFIYMSSLAAYGPGDALLLDCVKSSNTPNPLTSYGKSKLESEKYLSTLRNFPYLIIRPTAVYGPREKNLLTVFKLINNNIELIMGFRKQHLTFIYIKDLIKIVFEAMESAIVNKGYFVSDGYIYDSMVLGEIIRKQLEKKTIRLKIPIGLVRFIALISESTKYITGKQSVLNLEKINELECINWKCDIQPLIDELGFKPEYDLKKGIYETIEWYKEAKWLK